MSRKLRALGLLATAMAVVGLACSVLAQELKNTKVLKAKDKKEVMKIMGEWTKSTTVKCVDCHVSLSEPEKEDKELFGKGRAMAELTQGVNELLGESGEVGCYSCHRGSAKMPDSAKKAAVPAPDASPDVMKKMGALTKDVNEKFKAQLAGAKVTCGTCHHGEAKVPKAP